jgi:Zn-dependent protease/CBS domain-containing protein
MRASFKIGSIAGVEIKIHLSLLIILVLLTYLFYVSPQPYGFIGFSTNIRLFLSLLSAISLFIAVLLHELAHSFVAMRYGISVKAIVLFIFGGLSVMEKMPKEPRKELFISLAGPLTSLLIGIVGYLLSTFPVKTVSSFFFLFSYFNIILAAFNLIPAFPMDGGRILRSLLARRMSYVRATRIAAEVGKILAVFMGITGILVFYNPWLILIAFFIYIGASEEERITTIEGMLGRFRVRDIMSPDVISVTPKTKIRELIEMMFKHKHLGYPVIDNGRLVGIVTLKDVINSDPEVEVEKVMSRNVVFINPEAGAFDAFKIMSERRIGRIPVVENGEVVGIISRSDLMKVSEILEALEVFGWKAKRG